MIFPILCVLFPVVFADFECLCNYNEEQAVLSSPTAGSNPIGNLYEFDCKPTVHGSEVTDHKTIQFEQQIGYVKMNSNIQVQMCPGEPSPLDIIVATTVTAAITSPTTETPTTTPPPTPVMSITTSTMSSTPAAPITTPTSTTPTTTTPATTTTSTTIPTTMTTTPLVTATPTTTTTATPTTAPMRITTSKVPHGHMEICPQHIHTDVTFKGGYFGQYGSFCYALIDWPRAFDGAESHCISQSGTLAAITNQGQQDYIHQLLIEHHFNGKAWIGLNDKTAEGTLTWTSGAPVSFTNFEQGYNQHSTHTHKSNDCFVITQRGEWVDQPCGVAVSIINFGETHPFICQYNVSAKLHTLFDMLPGVITVG